MILPKTKVQLNSILFAFVGPAGSGKTSLCQCVQSVIPSLEISISTTTRVPRPTENNGQHYHFIDRQAFKNKIAAGDFLEYAEFNNNLYGTDLLQLQRISDSGNDILLDIDVQGVEQLRAMFAQQLVTIFVHPPGWQELTHRLNHRGTETFQDIEARLEIARREVESLTRPGVSDYLVVNDDFDSATELCIAIVMAERARMFRISDKKLQNIIG